MKNSVKDNSNTIFKKIGKDFKNFLSVFSDAENSSEETLEEYLAATGTDNATSAELLQSLEDIEKGRHLIEVNTKISKPIKKLKTETTKNIEAITNTKMNIQRIETFNNELEL